MLDKRIREVLCPLCRVLSHAFQLALHVLKLCQAGSSLHQTGTVHFYFRGFQFSFRDRPCSPFSLLRMS